MVQVALTVSQPQQHTPKEMECGYPTYGALLMDGWMDGWVECCDLQEPCNPGVFFR